MSASPRDHLQVVYIVRYFLGVREGHTGRREWVAGMGPPIACGIHRPKSLAHKRRQYPGEQQRG